MPVFQPGAPVGERRPPPRPLLPEWREESVARAFELQRHFTVVAPAWSESARLVGLQSVATARFYPAAHENLERIVRELVSVHHQPEEDEYGALRASDFAFSRATEIVAEAYALKRDRLLVPLVSTDSSGGIRLTWISQGRQVRAVIPPTAGERRYIYHESSAGYGVEHDFDGSSLAKWLDWLRE